MTELRDPNRLMPLGPGTPIEAYRAALESLTPARLFEPAPIRRIDAAQACLAGLWLWNDFLDRSHEISQDLATSEGSYWHAILHRREPDAWNSKYWWRKVGAHPVLDQLREHAPSLGYAHSTPEAFVDFCERVRGTGSADENLAIRVQSLEWQLLFEHCRRLAISGS